MVVVVVALVAGSAIGQAGKVDPKKATGPNVAEQLSALGARQESLEAGLQRLGNDLGELRESLKGLREELRQQQESIGAAHQHDRDMREEVRGLYVETSGLKGDIAQVGQQVDGARQELDSFRFSSGIIAALIVVLQVVVGGVALRGRG